MHDDDQPIDELNRHEVLHTASVVADMFDRHVAEHRYTQSDAELKAAAEKVTDALYGFYQLVGRKTFDPG